MARSLISLQLRDEDGDIVPSGTVLILNEDGTAFGQTIYAASTGSVLRGNPITADAYGNAIGYTNLPQRAIARFQDGDTIIDTPFDIESDPATNSGVTLDGVAITGATTVDVAVPPGTDEGAWIIRTTGSNLTDHPSWEGGRDSLIRLVDTVESETDSAALVIDVIEDTPGALVVRTGLHAKSYTRVDRGESSPILAVQTGGGGTLTAYKVHRLRPTGRQNYSYSSQGALEVASGDMGQAILAQSGFDPGTGPGNPDPTLNGAIDAAVVTIPLSSAALIPVPGAAVPEVGSGISTWPSPMFVNIDSEWISYTGVAGSSLTGCVRGAAGTTAAAHLTGATVRWVPANHAMLIRMAEYGSKGICVVPSVGTFDTRPAFAVASPAWGQPADTSARIVIRMNGAVETSGMISTTNDILTSHLLGYGSAPAITLGASAGTGPTLVIDGTDTSGRISVLTGTLPSASNVIVTITFARAFTAAPKVVLLTPGNGNAAALSGAACPWIDIPDITTTSFKIRVVTALTATTSYQWYYAVIA